MVHIILNKKHTARYRKARWRDDPRAKGFSHERFFGSVTPGALATPLGRELGPIDNQKDSLRCTGYGNAADGWYIHGIRMHPDWMAAKVGQVMGYSVDGGGGNPSATMKAMRDYGFLPRTAWYPSLDTNSLEDTGWRSFPDSLNDEAKQYDNVPGFVNVDGPYDIFDNVRSALAKAYDPVTKRGACVHAFSSWYYEWSFAADGIISNGETIAGGHHYIFVDWVNINGRPYLVLHNSGGIDVGRKGFYFMPREEINRIFSRSGNYLKINKTLTPGQVDLAKQESPLGFIQRLIMQAWFMLSEKFGL